MPLFGPHRKETLDINLLRSQSTVSSYGPPSYSDRAVKMSILVVGPPDNFRVSHGVPPDARKAQACVFLASLPIKLDRMLRQHASLQFAQYQIKDRFAQ